MSSETINTAGAFSQERFKNRIFFTIFILIIYRLGTYVPLAGIDLSVKRNYGSSQKGLLVCLICSLAEQQEWLSLL